MITCLKFIKEENTLMKKINLFLLSVIFVFSSCGVEAKPEVSPSSPTEIAAPSETDFLDAEESAKPFQTIELILPDPDRFDECDYEQISFEEAVSQSYCIVRAKCIGAVSQTREERVYAFERSEVLSGGEMPQYFLVTVIEGDYAVEDSTGYLSSDIWYREDVEYILPLRKSTSVFYSEDAYYPCGDAFIELDEDGAAAATFIQGRTMETFTSKSDVHTYIQQNGLTCGETEEDAGVPYTESTDPDEIIRCSDYILEVEMTGYFQNWAEDRTTYECKVTENLKTKTNNVSTVYAALPKDSAEIGKKYLLLLNRCSDTSYVFVVSSLGGSVYAADSPEAEEIRGKITQG